MTDTHEIDEPEATSEAADPSPAIPPGARPTALRNLGIVAILALLALQAVLLVMAFNTGRDVADLRDEIAAGNTATTVANLGGSSGQASQGPTTDTAPTTGNLPRFAGGEADPALGRKVGDLAGLEYYSGQATTVSTSDGTARAFMVWAHWCPYCQEELPLLADWQIANSADLEHFELVSISSSVDETAGNPLIPYLDENEFPFPVLLDEDESLARQLGVNAFPFWVFVAPDGTVVGRATGYIEPAALDDVFTQLNEMGAGGGNA